MRRLFWQAIFLFAYPLIGLVALLQWSLSYKENQSFLSIYSVMRTEHIKDYKSL